MCTKLISFVCLVLLLGLISPVWAAYVTPAVENFSFELPGDGKHNAWDEETNGKGSFMDVPDWESDIGAQDSGVESAWPGATEGVYSGFMMNAPDGPVWNIVSYRVVSGDQFLLAVDSRNNWTEGDVPLLQITLGYVAVGGARTPIATTTVAPALGLPDNSTDWPTYYLDVPDAEVAAGSLLYIELQNVSEVGEKKSWIGVDNVRFVPEPATILLLGLGSLGLIRRKR